jgi:hypothetical protein
MPAVGYGFFHYYSLGSGVVTDSALEGEVKEAGLAGDGPERLLRSS